MSRRFVDHPPEYYSRPDLNPYLRLHRSYGPPVILGGDAPGFRGDWSAAFGGRQAPLHVEIGSGNGFFLAGMAARRPDWNWLGLEIRFKRVVLCARKIDAAGVTNARIARYDVHQLDDLFTAGSIAGLYVNFPDPWSKKRNAKKRLLARRFAEWVARALRPGAVLRVKTDDPPNVDRICASLDGLPLTLAGRIDDVARDGLPWPAEDDIVTNYQSKFHKVGTPVFAVKIIRASTSPSLAAAPPEAISTLPAATAEAPPSTGPPSRR